MAWRAELAIARCADRLITAAPATRDSILDVPVGAWATTAAASGGHATASANFSDGDSQPKGLSRTLVERMGDVVEVGLGEQREVGALGKVLAQQAVGVLVGAALPGARGGSAAAAAGAAGRRRRARPPDPAGSGGRPAADSGNRPLAGLDAWAIQAAQTLARRLPADAAPVFHRAAAAAGRAVGTTVAAVSASLRDLAVAVAGARSGPRAWLGALGFMRGRRALGFAVEAGPAGRRHVDRVSAPVERQRRALVLLLAALLRLPYSGGLTRAWTSPAPQELTIAPVRGQAGRRRHLALVDVASKA